MALTTWKQTTVDRGRGAWTVTLTREGYVGPVGALTLLGDLSLEWGKRSADGIGEPVLYSRLLLRALDDDGELYEAFRTESAFGLTVTDDTGRRWDGIPRLDTLERPYASRSRRTVEITCICGLALNRRAGWFYLPDYFGGGSEILPTAPFDLLRRPLLVAQARPTRFVLPWRVVAPDGTSTGFETLTLPDAGQMFSGAEGALLTSEQLMQSIGPAFGARIWQGLDGQWHVESRRATGQAVAASSLDTFTASADFTPVITRPAVAARLVSVTMAEIYGEPRVTYLPRVGAVRLKRVFRESAYYDGGATPPRPVNLVRDPRFVAFDAGGAPGHWVVVSGTAAKSTTTARPETFSLKLNRDTRVRQVIGTVERGQAAFLRFRCKGYPSYSWGSTKLGVSIRLVDRNGISAYLTEQGAWSYIATDGPLVDSAVLAFTWVSVPTPNPSDPNEPAEGFWTLAQAEPFPHTGRLELDLWTESTAAAAPEYLLIDDVELSAWDQPATGPVQTFGAPVNTDPSTVNENAKPVRELSYLFGDPSTGETVTLELRGGDAGQWRDISSGEGTGNGTYLTTGGDDNVPFRWADESGTVATSYEELLGAHQLAERSGELLSFEGNVRRLLDPGDVLILPTGEHLVAVWMRTNLLLGTTAGLWVEKRTFYGGDAPTYALGQITAAAPDVIPITFNRRVKLVAGTGAAQVEVTVAGIARTATVEVTNLVGGYSQSGRIVLASPPFIGQVVQARLLAAAVEDETTPVALTNAAGTLTAVVNGSALDGTPPTMIVRSHLDGGNLNRIFLYVSEPVHILDVSKLTITDGGTSTVSTASTLDGYSDYFGGFIADTLSDVDPATATWSMAAGFMADVAGNQNIAATGPILPPP